MILILAENNPTGVLMSIKKLLADQKMQQMQSAVAFALITAPSPYTWEKTVSIEVLAEEVRKFLNMKAAYIKRVITAIKKTIAQWLPSGWVTFNEQKGCITLLKSAEPEMENLAKNFQFA